MVRDERTKETESALTHPSKRIAVRLTDEGQILIQAGDYAGIVVDEETGVVTVYGSEIRFMSSSVTVNGSQVSTKEQETFSQKDQTGEVIRLVGSTSDQ